MDSNNGEIPEEVEDVPQLDTTEPETQDYEFTLYASDEMKYDIVQEATSIDAALSIIYANIFAKGYFRYESDNGRICGLPMSAVTSIESKEMNHPIFGNNE